MNFRAGIHLQIEVACRPRTDGKNHTHDADQTKSIAAGKRHGILLLLGSCLPILGAVLLGPVLPDIAAHFASVPHVGILAPLMMTTPALMVALSAPFMGAIIDRQGRRKPLIAALVVYSIVGLAPIFLMSLHLMLGSRLLLGITEALIMTACTTLIADYYDGKKREVWLSAQAGAASLAATVFFAAGGILGGIGWRVPFILYAAGFVMLPFVLWLIYEPSFARAKTTSTQIPVNRSRHLVFSNILALVAGIGLLLLPIQFGFLLEGLGVHSPQIIGLLSASNQGAVLVGAMLFPLVSSRTGFHWIFAVALLLSGAGTFMGGLSGSISGLLISGIVAGLGSGLLLTSLINWTFDSLSAATRGRGAGWFNGCLFFGEFLSPVVVFGLAKNGGSLTTALQACGVLIFAFAILGFVYPLAQRRLAESLGSGLSS